MTNIKDVDAHETNLAASEIHGQLAIVDSIFRSNPEQVEKEGPIYMLLNLNFIHLTQDMFLNRTRVFGSTHLEGAEIGGNFFLLGATLGPMVAQGITIKGALRVGYNQRPNGQPGRNTSWSGLV